MNEDKIVGRNEMGMIVNIDGRFRLIQPDFESNSIQTVPTCFAYMSFVMVMMSREDKEFGEFIIQKMAEYKNLDG